MLNVYAATSPANANEVADIMTDVMLTLTTDVNEPELARAKAQLKAGLVMNLESASVARRSDRAAVPRLWAGARACRSGGENRQAVEPDDIKKLAHDLMISTRPAISAVGALKSLASTDGIAAKFAWLGSASRPESARVRDRMRRRDRELLGTWHFLQVLSTGRGARAARRTGVPAGPANGRSGELVGLRGKAASSSNRGSLCGRHDELTRTAFRHRVKRAWRDIEEDAAYPFLIFTQTEARALRRADAFQCQARRGANGDAGLLGRRAVRAPGLHGRCRSARYCRSCSASWALHRLEAACLPHNEASVRLAGIQRIQPPKAARADT